MGIMCRVEQSEVDGKLRGLRIVHPDMGLIMDWGSRLPTAVVRHVPQQLAFQMMADIERIKTHLLDRQQGEIDVAAACGGVMFNPQPQPKPRRRQLSKSRR